MAYLRYGPDSDWYVFWYSDNSQAGSRLPKNETRLAVWHSDDRETGPLFRYPQVREMLDADDFSRVPGFEPSHRALLRGALAEFARDVDDEYAA